MFLNGGKMTDNFYDPEKNYNPWAVEKSFEDWLLLGIQNNWISKPVCSTHDGIPQSLEEDKEWENGGDPCIYALRLYVNEEEKRLVEENSGIVNG
jgi:hypothetical protein